MAPPAERERTTWTVVIETHTGDATAEDLGPFLRALLANAGAIAPAASFDTARRTLVAQFQVFADTRVEAALRGCFAYWGAIAAAGVTLEAESRVEVAPVDDAGDSEQFTAHVLLARG